MTNSLKWFLFVLKVFKTGIHSLFIEFMHQLIPPVPIPPPPPPSADPWALAFFLPWMANSRG